MYNKPYPWLPKKAVEFMESYLDKNMDVLEFGCGHSTIWMGDKVNSVWSVEGNAEWRTGIYDKVKHWSNVFIELQLHPWVVPPRMNQEWDFILVDGRSRVKCFKAALPYLKEGGVIMLDNSEREEYAECFEMVKGWKMFDAYGPDFTGTWTYPNWRCTWWVKTY